MADTDQKALAEEAKEATPEQAKKAAVPYHYDPAGRFTGNGVMFKAKLFGTADVNEPRGDAVCNTAIALLKSAVRTTGEHKQKIFFKINMSGITLLDAVNQLKIYEHPVNKISFISRDPVDTRAFGYIVTEKEGKHTYFGIKTEKAADQVVTGLRDMFQVVFEQKKKEAETNGQSAESKDSAPAASTAAAPVTAAAATSVATTSAAPVGTSPTPTTPTTEPVLGYAADAATKQVKREDSASHLLELLGDLSFDPTPSTAAPVNQNFSQSQPWPPQNPAAASWGNAVPAQNDPFAPHSQQQMFGQQPNMQMNGQNVAFPQQQSGFPAPFNQPNTQSPFSQPFSQPHPQQAMFANQPPQVLNQQVSQSLFGAPQQQPPMFQMPQQQLQQPAVASPFAQQPQVAAFQSSPFANDPFSTGGFQQVVQPQMQAAPQPQATNPFASSGGEAFGVLQPQQVQVTPRPSVGQMQQPNNLFSDLNPLPSMNPQPIRKDQFFSDVKNPPRPKLNEMQTTKTQQADPAANNTIQPFANFTNTPQNYDWINQLMSPPPPQIPATVAASVAPAQVPVGLIAPPPSHNRQRQGQQPLLNPM